MFGGSTDLKPKFNTIFMNQYNNKPSYYIEGFLM